MVFFTVVLLTAHGQKIVVDTASTSKYLIKKQSEEAVIQAPAETPEELTCGDRAISIGTGILNRLKARLNLEEAAESIKAKKERIVGSGTKSE